MSEEFGPTFVTVTDEDGVEIVLEYVASVEHNGIEYRAFFPAETEEEETDDADSGLVILKIVEENGEELLSTCDTEEELSDVYDLVMELLFEDEEDS